MIRRILVLLGITAVLVVGVAATPVFAATNTSPVHLARLWAQDHHAQIAQAVAVGLGYVSAHLVAWTVHVDAPAKVKATAATILGTVAGVVASLGWAADMPWWGWVKAIFFAFAAQQIAYLMRNANGVAALQGTGLAVGAPRNDNADVALNSATTVVDDTTSSTDNNPRNPQPVDTVGDPGDPI